MNGVKISELDELSKSTENDLLVIVDTTENETKKIKIGNIDVGVDIPIQSTPPENPKDGDLYIDIGQNNVLRFYEDDQWNNTTAGITGDTLPIGTIVPYGNYNAPTGWLNCNGQAVSRTTYAGLFSIIGTQFGEGDGSTTFNVPDLNKYRVPIGYDRTEEQSERMNLGTIGGEEKHTMTIDELVAHTHGFVSGTINVIANQFSSTAGVTNYQTGEGLGTTTISPTGNSQPFNVMQPYVTTNYIIKAFQSSGVVANVAQTKTTSDTDTYSCNYVNKIGRRVHIFNGSVAMNNVITIATTWEHIGKFKNLVIECGEGNINSFCSAIIPFEQLATGDNLNLEKLNSNIFAPIYIGDGKNNYLHLIPNSNIGENTIQFDGISDTAIVRNIYVDY